MKFRIISLLILLVGFVFSVSSCATGTRTSYLSHPGGESIWYEAPKGNKGPSKVKAPQNKHKGKPNYSFLRKR